jgi:hypothetical protein
MIDGAWHIAASSPCMNMGVATEAPGVDFENEARPGGGAMDIGHDEMP